MENNVPCPICHTSVSCVCISSTTRYFTLLKAVQDRVLSQKDASIKTTHPPTIGAGIDKINMRFKEPFPINQITSNAHKLGLKVSDATLKEKGRFFKIHSGDTFIHFKCSIMGDAVTQMISNPNRFRKWDIYLGYVNSLIPIDIIEDMSLSRLDLNLDFACSFQDLIQSIEVKHKNLSAKFEDKGGHRTGLTIGSGDELFVLYDKSRKNGLKTNYSRIEQRLMRAKLPTRSLFEIPNSLALYSPFKNLEGGSVRFLSSLGLGESILKLQEFKYCLEREGFYSARKAFNTQRNFERDFKGLVLFEKWDQQPKEIFKAKIKTFFEPTNQFNKFMTIH